MKVVIQVILPAILVATAMAAATSADFVVVGGGTAGCVLAARLCSALPKAKIVLLERGQKRDAVSEFTVRSPRFAFEASLDRNVAEVWETLPEKGLLGRRTGISTGNTLGGSSSINGMQWSVPLEGTVKGWHIEGLSETVARKYFRRAFRKVGFSQPPRPLRQIYADDYVKASTKLGFKNEFDPFDQTERFSVWNHAVAVTRTGRRIDSCTAYVSPVLNGRCKKNLKLVQGVTVTKVLLNDEHRRRAVGVEYVGSDDKKLKKKITISANREVLLAAGPYGSPKVLQLSGIGARKHLEKVGIPVKIDLPVGLQTQGRAANLVVYVYQGAKLEPSNNSTILNSSKTRRRWDQGKVSVLGKHPAAVINIGGRNGYSAMGSAGDASALDVPIISTLCLNNPTSFGYALIKDSNPFSVPNVQLNLLKKREDFERLKRCMEGAIDIFAHFPPGFRMTPVAPSHGLNETYIRETAVHGYHFVGGCAVDAVLERNLKVRGVEGLRVIDSSALKTMPISAGPLASTYMVAEYSSDKLARLYRREFK